MWMGSRSQILRSGSASGSCLEALLISVPLGRGFPVTPKALRADVVPENELVYLSLMPVLLRNTGVIKDGKPLSFEEMSELLRKEILNLNLSFTGNFKTNRYELIARASGNNASESQRAVEWIKTVLQNPNWRAENLPRPIALLVNVNSRQGRDLFQEAQDAVRAASLSRIGRLADTVPSSSAGTFGSGGGGGAPKMLSST